MPRPLTEDTDPEIGLGRPSRLDENERRPERTRSVFLPLGMLAVLVLGVHAAADSFADWAFAFIDWLAGLVEALFAWFASAALSEPEARSRALAEALDVERRRDMARWTALVVEVVLVVRLGAACMSTWPAGPSLGASPKAARWPQRLLDGLARPLEKLKLIFARTGGYLSSLSVEKVYLPLSVAIAVLAGSLALFVALDNVFFALSRHLPGGPGTGAWLSPWPAAIAALVVLYRLGLPAVIGTLARCQRSSERDLSAGEPLTRRTLRGLWGALLILPILVAGIWTGTPLGAWVGRALGAGT